MSRKKKAQEELMKTHVLNLNEIRAAEEVDKRERRKKIPAVFFVIGFILIFLGLSISSIVAYKNSHKEDKKEVVKDRSKLKCISNVKHDYYLMDLHTEVVYQFKNGKLYSSKVNSTSKPSGTTNYIEVLVNDIHINSYNVDSYVDQNINYNLKVISPSELQIKYNIKYDNYVLTTFQSVIDDYIKIPSLSSENTYNQVKKQAEKLGALCN